MDQALLDELKQIMKGDVVYDDQTLTEYSHDASLFEVRPQVVVFPKDEADVEALVGFVEKHKQEHPELSLTGRAAGTDMGGGSINDSITVAFGKYFNHTPVLNGDIVTVQPGVFYHDLEPLTLNHGVIFASYPASRELCAMGGIVNNNSGGEKSLKYGKTERYVKRLKMVLHDGKAYEFKALDSAGLKAKMAQQDFEGDTYRRVFDLVSTHYDELKASKPQVSKNSAGYYLWNVWDKESDVFDLTKLFVGAQGTLGLMLEADLQLVPTEKHREMMVIFLHDLTHLGQIINEVLPLQPESFESYDDNTLKLALKFFPDFAKMMGTMGVVQTGLQFLPEAWTIATGGMPKLVLQVDFTGNDLQELQDKIAQLKEKLKPLHPQTRVVIDDQEKKYWLIRRESFNMLRHKIRDRHTAPFIDDFVVPPQYLPEFLPKLNAIFARYKGLIYTVAGHVGDGNFHVIPLMKIEDPQQRAIIPRLGQEVYDLVLQYHGSTTGEHNDGLVRTPYLEQMYGKQVVKLFEETKKIFDPDDIFNPRKKVGGSLDYAMSHIRMHW